MKMEIQNIVASAKYAGVFDISHVLQSYDHIATRLPQFPAVTIKLNVSDLCQVYTNGTIIILGASSIQETNKLYNSYVELLRKIGYIGEYTNFRIVNIVARYVHPEKIHLNNLKIKHNLIFLPEIFPAAHFRIEHLKITINIFRSGKCMILGAKSVDAVDQAVNLLQELLCKQ
jgi:transcription initiation factor TFIID TATA-box-binding protein